MRFWAVAVLLALVLAGCAAQQEEDEQGEEPMPAAGPPVFGAQGVVESKAILDVLHEARQAVARLVNTGYTGAEPNIGITSSGAIFTTAFEQTLRSRDGGRSWDVVQDFSMIHPATGIGTSDPMLWVDSTTDRVWVNHMFGTNCFNMLWSDDEGDTWMQRDGACATPGVDHQKVAAAPPGPGANPFTQAMPLHSSVLYTCYNKYVTVTVLGTDCFMSYDGGLTYPVETRAFDGSTDCGGINGHPAFAPDWTIVVPAALYCGPEIAVSSDSGLTWTVRSGPEGATAGASVDPDVAFDADGTLYLMWRSSDHMAQLAASDDLGQTWRGPWNITAPGVTSTRFHVASAGDDGRVAMAYLGTDFARGSNWTDAQGTEHEWEGRPNDAPPNATWHLYIVTLEDDGSDAPYFVSHQATPDDDPVQKGCAWEGGGSGGPRACRNMLDFIDSAVAPNGTFYVAYTDGCTHRAGPGQREGKCAEDAAAADEMNSRDREIAVAWLDGWSLKL